MSPALLIAATLAAAPQAELIDFTATWCGPCQKMKPIIEQLHREGYPVRQVDVDQHRALAQRYNVTALPTFILVVNDQEVARLVGARPESELRRMLKRIPDRSKSPPPEAPEKKPRWLPDFLDGEEKTEQVSATETPSVARGQSPDAPAAASDRAGIAPAAAQDPLKTSVRIRVKDAQGVDYGSGTVIGSKDGQALILTCWHIFRGSSPEDTIKVDLFLNGPNAEPQTFPGQFIKGNEKADVALVGITGCPMMPVSPIASTDEFPKPSDIVMSVGCGEGKPQPTKLQHRVTRLNPFNGPDTTECTGEPVVGRSGGGLFNANGHVIGVCFAAERDKTRGVYVGPSEIHTLLKEAGFAALVPDSQPTLLAETAGSTKATAEAITEAITEDVKAEAKNIFASLGTSSTSVPVDAPVDDASEAVAEAVSGHPSIAPLDSSHASGVLASLADGEIEATVVLRRRDQPNLPSQVIVINKVSNRFRRYLTGEISDQPTETSLRTPARKPRRLAGLAAIFNNRDQ